MNRADIEAEEKRLIDAYLATEDPDEIEKISERLNLVQCALMSTMDRQTLEE